MGAEQSTEAEANPEEAAATKLQSIARGRTARKQHPCVWLPLDGGISNMDDSHAPLMHISIVNFLTLKATRIVSLRAGAPLPLTRATMDLSR